MGLGKADDLCSRTGLHMHSCLTAGQRTPLLATADMHMRSAEGEEALMRPR